MNRKRWITLFVLLALALQGCSKTSPILSATPTTTLQSTLTPTSTAKPAIPSSTATSTSTPTSTTTPTPTLAPLRLVRKCTESASSQPFSISTGSLVFYSRPAQAVMTWFAGEKAPRVYTRGFTNYLISPYTGTLVWFDDDNMLYFRTLDGKKGQITLDERWGYVRQWLPDDQLLMAIPYKNQNHDPQHNKAQDDFYVLRLASGQATHFHLEFPGYFDLSFLNKAFRPTISYDPTLHWVIYAWADVETPDTGMLLWDIEKEEVVWKGEGWEWPTELSEPDWQINGNHLVTTLPLHKGQFLPELFSLSTTGELTRWTWLADTFGDASGYMVSFPQWSPDNRYIAMRFESEAMLGTDWLYVVDTQTGVTYDYCLPIVGGIVWSPDSRQIAFVRSEDRADDDTDQLVILDVQSGIFQSMDGSFDVFGWVEQRLP